MTTYKVQAGILHQSTGQQTTFAQHLKSVADAEDKLSRGGKFFDRLHNGRKSCKCSGPKVIPIGKSAGNDNCVKFVKVSFLMPDKIYRLSHMLRNNMVRIMIAIGTGKYYYAEFHKNTGSPDGSPG